jgi:hypothetical protein
LNEFQLYDVPCYLVDRRQLRENQLLQFPRYYRLGADRQVLYQTDTHRARGTLRVLDDLQEVASGLDEWVLTRLASSAAATTLELESPIHSQDGVDWAEFRDADGARFYCFVSATAVAAANRVELLVVVDQGGWIQDIHPIVWQVGLTSEVSAEEYLPLLLGMTLTDAATHAAACYVQNTPDLRTWRALSEVIGRIERVGCTVMQS